MKKSLKASASVFMSVLLFLALSVTAFAADSITVNGEEVKSGDTVTYEYYLSGVKDPLEGAGAYITYDSKSLELVEDSIGFDVLSNAMYNIEPGSIYYSAIDVIKGFDVSDEKLMVTLTFKVLDGAKGDLKIEHSFDEIFTLVNEEVDLTEKEYTGREVTTVNTYTENTAPYQGIDAKRLEEYQQSSETDFDNMMLGTDKEELAASAAAASGNNASASASGETVSDPEENTASSVDAVSSGASSAVSSAAPDSKNSTSAVVAIVIAVFVVLLIGAVVLSIVKGKKQSYN